MQHTLTKKEVRKIMNDYDVTDLTDDEKFEIIRMREQEKEEKRLARKERKRKRQEDKVREELAETHPTTTLEHHSGFLTHGYYHLIYTDANGTTHTIKVHEDDTVDIPTIARIKINMIDQLAPDVENPPESTESTQCLIGPKNAGGKRRAKERRDRRRYEKRKYGRYLQPGERDELPRNIFGEIDD